MFIKSLEASNFRTLENFNVVFNGYYTAISGKNNAGKSNILRAIRTIVHSGRKLINPKEAKDGRNELKCKLLEKIIENNTTIGLENFYKLTKDINNAYK